MRTATGLIDVDEMLEMNADDPEVLREAQDVAIQAGRKVREIQERIARLVGPHGPLPTLQGFSWPDTEHVY